MSLSQLQILQYQLEMAVADKALSDDRNASDALRKQANIDNLNKQIAALTAAAPAS